MLTSDKKNVNLLISNCVSNGIKHIVFSPGSRNAPLIIAFNKNPFFTTHLIHDERCAAFFAIGLIQMLKKPVIVCCTSGSAVTNYYPAVTESFYRNIPLLVVSSDRPQELIDQGDGQTIKQKNVFGDHVHKSIHINDFQEMESVSEYQRDITDIMNSLVYGPCHVNMSFHEPLYNCAPNFEYDNLDEIDFSAKIHSDFNHLPSSLWKSKIMIIVGQFEPNLKLNNIIQRLSEFSNIVVLAENISNIHGESIVHCLDRVLNFIDKKNTQDYLPETVIHIGGPIVSKRIKKFLRKVESLSVVRVSEKGNAEDTFQNLVAVATTNEEDFLLKLESELTNESITKFSDKWKSANLKTRDTIEEFVKNNRIFCDWYVFYLFNQFIQEKSVIHIGNSSAIRYMQLFEPIPNCTYYSNRGTSGIEGSISTAIGSAIADKQRQHYLIVGDTSFIYDSNALWIRPYPKNLKIIIVNNQGGGIFRIIEGSKDTMELEKYFEAKHDITVKPIISAFGHKCIQCFELNELENKIQNILNANQENNFLEIFTPNEVNPNVLFSFNDYISKC